MTEQEKRIKLAQTFKWRPFMPGPLCTEFVVVKGTEWGSGCTICSCQNCGVEEMYHDIVPDYFNDETAIIEAIRNHDFDDKSYYVAELEKLCGWNLFDTINATASQRADAFGKTLKLW